MKAPTRFEKMKQWMRGSYRSGTMWFNSVVGLVLAALPEAVHLLPQLEMYLPADIYRWLTLITILGNYVLRVKTTQSLLSKGKDRS